MIIFRDFLDLPIYLAIFFERFWIHLIWFLKIFFKKERFN